MTLRKGPQAWDRRPERGQPLPRAALQPGQHSLFSHYLEATLSEFTDTGLTGRQDRSSWGFPGGPVAETASSQYGVRVKFNP